MNDNRILSVYDKDKYFHLEIERLLKAHLEEIHKRFQVASDRGARSTCRYCQTSIEHGKNDYNTLLYKMACDIYAKILSNIVNRTRRASQSIEKMDAMYHRMPQIPALLLRIAHGSIPPPTSMFNVCDGGLLEKGDYNTLNEEDLPECLSNTIYACRNILLCGCHCQGMCGELSELCPPCPVHHPMQANSNHVSDDTCPICIDDIYSKPMFISGTYQPVERFQSPTDEFSQQLAKNCQKIGINGRYIPLSAGKGNQYEYMAWDPSCELPPLLPFTRPRRVCQHKHHYQCIITYIRSANQQGDRLTFNHLRCPLCNLYIYHPMIIQELVPQYALEQFVVAKSAQQLVDEGLIDDEHVTIPGAPFYQDPVAYALDHYVFSQCYRCKRPYFSGAAECQVDDSDSVDPSLLICSDCNPASGIKCEEHGKDAIIYKCKFCCSVSVFKCWGNTDFCQQCHQAGVWQTLVHVKTGENKKHILDYPQCPSIATQLRALAQKYDKNSPLFMEKAREIRSHPNECKIGAHAPNGFNFAIGCSLCSLSKSSNSTQKSLYIQPSAKDLRFKFDHFEIYNPLFDQIGLYSYLFLIRTAFNKLQNSRTIDTKRNTPIFPLLSRPSQAADTKTEKMKFSVSLSPVFDTDGNGLFYFLGTMGNTQPFVNPVERGFVECTSTPLVDDSLPALHILDRNDARCVTRNDTSEAYFIIDLKLLRLAPTHYSFKHYSTMDLGCVRSWSIDGSHDGKQWEILRNHINDYSLKGESSSQVWPIEKGIHYRYFRIMRRGANCAIDKFLACGAFELYGSLSLPSLSTLLRTSADNYCYTKALIGKNSLANVKIPPLMAQASHLIPNVLDLFYIGHKFHFHVTSENTISTALTRQYDEVTSASASPQGSTYSLSTKPQGLKRFTPTHQQRLKLPPVPRPSSLYYQSTPAIPPGLTLHDLKTLPLPDLSQTYTYVEETHYKTAPQSNIQADKKVKQRPIESTLEGKSKPQGSPQAQITSPAGPISPPPGLSKPPGLTKSDSSLFPSQMQAQSQSKPVREPTADIALSPAPSHHVSPPQSPQPQPHIPDNSHSEPSFYYNKFSKASYAAPIPFNHGKPVDAFTFIGTLHNEPSTTTPFNPVQMGSVHISASNYPPQKHPISSLIGNAAIPLSDTIVVNACPTHGYDPLYIIDESGRLAASDPAPSALAWIMIDFGAYRLQLHDYFLNMNVCPSIPAGWQIEGSHGPLSSSGDYSWIPIVTHEQDQSLQKASTHSHRFAIYDHDADRISSSLTPSTQRVHTALLDTYATNNPTALFRYIRIRLTTAHASLYLRAFTLSGRLFTTEPPLDSTPQNSLCSTQHAMSNRYFYPDFIDDPRPLISGGTHIGVHPHDSTQIFQHSLVNLLTGATSKLINLPNEIRPVLAAASHSSYQQGYSSQSIGVPGLYVSNIQSNQYYGILYAIGTAGYTTQFDNPAGNPLTHTSLYNTAVNAELQRSQGTPSLQILQQYRSYLTEPITATMKPRFQVACYTSTVDLANIHRASPSSVLTIPVASSVQQQQQQTDTIKPWISSDGEPNQYVILDLGAYTRVQLESYSLSFVPLHDQDPNNPPGLMRNWQLFGSLDAQNWDVLAVHINDTLVSKDNPTGLWNIPAYRLSSNQSTYTPSGAKLELNAYRFFCIIQTGPNSNGGHQMALSNIEIYGTMVSSSAPLSVHPFPCRNRTPPQPISVQQR